MKNFLLFVFPVLCMALQGCPSSCDDKMVVWTVRNNSQDTIYCGSAIPQYPPSAKYHLCIIPPERECKGDLYKEDIDYYGLSFYIVRKSIADSCGLQEVMDKRLYDKVYTYYSFDEFAAHNFVVEITQEDLYGLSSPSAERPPR